MIDGAFASAASTVCPSTPGAPLLRITFSSACARLAFTRHSSSSRLLSTTPAPGPPRLPVPRFMQQNASPPGCVRWLRRFAPRRAVGEREVQLPWSRLSQSISPFGSIGFHRLHCYYEENRLPRGRRPVVVASSGSTAGADPRGSPWVRTRCPATPAPITEPASADFGRRVRRHVYSRSGLLRFTFVRTRGSPASSPHGLTAPRYGRLTPATACSRLHPAAFLRR